MTPLLLSLLVGGETTFHLMGTSVMIWIPLYCHLEWQFVCFLSAQDVLVERREVTIVSGGQKEKMCGDWLMCRQSSDIDIKIQSGNLNSSTVTRQSSAETWPEFYFEKTQTECQNLL